MNDDYQIDFDKIKEYLQEPPILMPPVEGRPLIILDSIRELNGVCIRET